MSAPIKWIEIGSVFDRWLVVGPSERRSSRGAVLWNCICECGTSRPVSGVLLRSGESRSCGCLSTERHPTASHPTARSHALCCCIEQHDEAKHGRASGHGARVNTLTGDAMTPAVAPPLEPQGPQNGAPLADLRRDSHDLRGFCFYSPREKRPAYV
jgi:hypothetical protein